MARFDSNAYKALNESINIVEPTNEDIQTAARNKEMLGKRLKVLSSMSKTPRDPAANKKAARKWRDLDKKDQEEKGSKKMYGLGGRVYEETEIDEYAAFLEGVLDALCEELEIDPNELFEDLQTPERAAQTRGRVYRTKRAMEYDDGDLGAYYNHQAARGVQDKERSDKTRLYGKGGKVVKRLKPKK